MKTTILDVAGMKTWAIFVFLMIGYTAVCAQNKPEPSQKEMAPVAEPANPPKEKPPTTESELPKKEPVKAVPVAKDQNAKPARIDNARANGARPSVTRPAKSPRPAGRAIRPGRVQ
jgi:hypothetical protein